MEVIEKTPERIAMRLEITESLANAIRRSVAEVPTLAIDDVEIFKNDSAVYDEVLAHRLGLIPLKTEKGMSSKTKIDLKLSKEGPGLVYAGDLKGPVDAVYEKIPITLLGEGKVELVATAILGKGIEHAKYTPGLCYYRSILEVKSSPEIDKIVEKSKGAIKNQKQGSKWLCDLNDAEINAIEKIDKEAIKNSKEIILIVESYGNMAAKDILLKAIDALCDNLDEFEKELK
ncbi:MAG: DNA-directed RNA polymerase subunit D [Nanoarchaeota archaeon]